MFLSTAILILLLGFGPTAAEREAEIARINAQARAGEGRWIEWGRQHVEHRWPQPIDAAGLIGTAGGAGFLLWLLAEGWTKPKQPRRRSKTDRATWQHKQRKEVNRAWETWAKGEKKKEAGR